MMSHKFYEFVCLSCDSYEWLNYEFSRHGYTLFCLIYQRVSKLRKSIREEVQTMMKQASKLAALAAATSALGLLGGCQGPVSEAKLARQLSDADVPIDRFLKMVAPRALGQRLGGQYAIVDGITSIDLPGVVYTKVFSRKTPGATSEHGLVYYLSATSRLNDDQSTPGAALYKITSDLGINLVYKTGKSISPKYKPKINRTLNSNKLKKKFQYKEKNWDILLKDLNKDYKNNLIIYDN